MAGRKEVECRDCQEDCYWLDGVLYEVDTDEPHRCQDDDLTDQFPELDFT